MTFKNKRVIVTGASGFIGQHLCKALIEKEAIVVGFSRSTLDSKYLSVQYDVDILDQITIRQIVYAVQPDFVVHLAASKDRSVDTAAYREGYETNLMGSLNLINACQDIPVLARFVFLGSTDEYGKLQVPFKETEKEAPINAYGASKLAVTELLKTLARSNGFSSVILRPSIVYGPGQDDSMFLPALIRALVAGNSFDMSLGEQTRDFVYVDDLVQAIIQALLAPSLCGDVINISSATPIRIDALAKMTANILGKGAEELLKFGAKDYRTSDVMQYWAANTLAKSLLGWSPTVSLEEGVQRTVDYFKAAAVK